MTKSILKNRQYLYNLTTEEVSSIKDFLTYDNPAYKSALRYSKSRYISIPPYLSYYTEGYDDKNEKYLSVPIGVDVEKILHKKIESVVDKRVDSIINYPTFKLDLRNDQKIAFEHYYKSIQTPNPQRIVQLPTGKGKSILALYIASVLKEKTLILVHKDDLVVGWTKDIKLCFGDEIEIGLIKAKKRVVGEQITIATVQTLHRMDKEELSKYLNQFGLVVQDEVHHCALNMFNIIDKFDSRHKLGLSATPFRTDGLNFVFDIFFGGICYRHEVTEDDEDISSVEVRVLDSKFKYRPFLHKGVIYNYYDFKDSDLPTEITFVEDIPYSTRPKIPHLVIDKEAVTNRKTKIMVCKKILEHYKLGHSIIVLFTQKEHIEQYYSYLSRFLPKNQIILYYGDSKEKSEIMMERAESKQSLITLATYAKATEGTNVKSWEVEFLVSSVNNEKNVEQAVGRIRRKKEGKIDPVIVYDVRYSDCYSIRNHYNTRNKAYTRLKFKIKDPKAKKSMFSRGYDLT